MSKRQFKPRTRTSGVRDARLIIIATEGNKTEPHYFNAIATYYRNSKVHVEVLERKSTASAPEHVITELDKFRREYSLNEHDELWLVIDLDGWGSGKLSEVSTQCEQKNYGFAVSNPCFEVWLLLHVATLDSYTEQELIELIENRKSNKNSKTRLEKELTKLCGAYNKENLDTSPFLEHVAVAIERARAIDIHPTHRWPNQLGTRVYLLAESILKK